MDVMHWTSPGSLFFAREHTTQEDLHAWTPREKWIDCIV